MPSIMEIYTKLITKEDSSGLHKVLGFACLVSFLMRLSLVGESNMGFDGSWSTPATLGLHLSLSLSSFAFKIPSKRITTGYGIWPEACLHALVFACRSFACIMFTWWWKHRQGKEDSKHNDGTSDLYFCIGNTFIVLFSCAAADLSSYSVGPLYRSHTIRDVKAPSAAKYFFSIMQFHATAACLLGSRRYTTQFLFVLVIQVNAFLMTLQRRNVASHKVLLVIYGFMLAIGFTLKSLEHLSQDIFWLVHTMANLAALLRIGLRVNKYLLWTGMGWVVHVGLRLESYASDDILWQACVASYAAPVGLGFLKLGGEKKTLDNRPVQVQKDANRMRTKTTAMPLIRNDIVLLLLHHHQRYSRLKRLCHEKTTMSQGTRHSVNECGAAVLPSGTALCYNHS